MNKSRIDNLLKRFHYCGWTPCLAGQLKFSYIDIGLCSVPLLTKTVLRPKSYLFSQNIAHTPYSLVSSVHNWRDRLPLDGRFRVLMLGRVNTNAQYNGEVYLWPFIDTLKGSYFKTNVEPLLNRINLKNSALTEIKSKPSIDDKALQEIESEVVQLSTDLSSALKSARIIDKRLFKVEFILDGSGLTFLKYINRDAKFSLYSEDLKSEPTIVRQSFYYIKYAFHRHKHHPQSEDSITTVFKLAGPLKDKQNLASAMINQILFAMVDIKRVHLRDFVNDVEHFVLGVNEYGKSLVETLYLHKFIDDQQKSSQLNYFSNISASYSVLQDKQRNEQLAVTNLKQKFVSLTMMFTALASLILLYSVNVAEVEGVKERLARYVSDETLKNTILFLPFIYIAPLGWYSFKVLNRNVWVKRIINKLRTKAVKRSITFGLLAFISLAFVKWTVTNVIAEVTKLMSFPPSI